ncbi:hypothetical protein LCGC14_1177140 [marine sediment metagenome]|uniref:Cadherin domain-containing protein n=1 Tax=marine sediment metagenome TaxID=412755 RepID=A0A0F9P660_9ZZZZ
MKNKIVKLFTCIISLVLISSFSLASLSMRGISTSVDNFSLSVPNLSAQDNFWPSNSSEWSLVAPETQGLDSDKISEMFEFIEKMRYDIRSVIIVRNGYLLTEEYLYQSQLIENNSYYGGSLIHDQWSTTKSLMSIMIGIALQEGFLDNISQTLYEFFAHIWEPSFVDSELKKNITIEQLLTMTSGYGDFAIPDAETKIADDWIKFALDEVPLVFTPGEVGEWEYSNEGPTLLSGIITNVTGKSTEEFAKEYLFTPLGISADEYDWDYDAQNISYGGYGFACSPKVQAKLGILCLNNGTWNGIQIVDKNFMKNATTTQISGGGKGDYGYLFYPNGPLEGFYTYGAAGQAIYVIPKYNITIGFAGIFLGSSYNSLILNYIVQFAEDNAPNWDQTPVDQLIQEGDSFLYDVNASDTSGVEYLINDIVNFNITTDGLITNSSSLSLGVYPLEIRAYNSFNNSITATIDIRVESISSNGIPGFDFNMIVLMILCTSVVIIIRRKKIFKNL